MVPIIWATLQIDGLIGWLFVWCVGIGGSGRQSATKLAANICGSTLFQIEITKHYTTVEWRDDIKKVAHSSFVLVS